MHRSPGGSHGKITGKSLCKAEGSGAERRARQGAALAALALAAVGTQTYDVAPDDLPALLATAG
ncbi:hypothetical protein AB0958_07615 [Streptomyces sp. NPDC006655]|uniref:hypothetical protein n=1 Tax=Streptomyces sp. NPDC006655 TaxID=3156898 RepID=UPI003451CDB4